MKRELTHGSLFSGVEGFGLGATGNSRLRHGARWHVLSDYRRVANRRLDIFRVKRRMLVLAVQYISNMIRNRNLKTIRK